MLLALLSGAVLLLMAALRLGFLANFLSHPVISGFISASGILIALGQLKHILGISIDGENAVQLLPRCSRRCLGRICRRSPSVAAACYSSIWSAAGSPPGCSIWA